MECPLCKTELEVTFDYGGLVVQCPVCSDYFKIPSVKECPQCLKRSFAKRDVCEECGYDFAAVEELIEKGGEEADGKLSLKQRFAAFLWDACPGLFSAGPLVAFFLSLAFLVIAGVVGAMMFLAGVIFTAGGVLIAGLVIYLHGFAALCLGEVCGLKTAFENLNGTSWEAFSILGFAPVVLGFIALGAAKYFM